MHICVVTIKHTRRTSTSQYHIMKLCVIMSPIAFPNQSYSSGLDL